MRTRTYRAASARRLRGSPAAALAGGVLLAALTACGNRGSQAASQAAGEDRRLTVEVARADRQMFRRRVEYPASVAANRQVTLVAKLPGEVQRVAVIEGDRVRRGQALLELDPRDFRIALQQAEAQRAVAQAGVEMARANLGNLEQSWRRVSALYEQHAVSESEYDKVDAGYKAAAAQFQGAQAQLLTAAAAVEVAQRNLDYTVVRAPFDGVIGTRLVDEGTRTASAPPTALLVVVDDAQVKLVGGIPERDIASVRPGAAAQVFVDALSAAAIPAAVDRVEPLVDTRTRTATVRVVVANQDRRLQVGMSARVAIEQSGYEAPALPDDAITRDELEPSRGTVVVVADGRVHRQEVQLGERDGSVVSILSGLAGGETVVRGNQAQLKEGQSVAVASSQVD